jgi:branched-chain amino acid transport system substrate-binding protein
MLGSLMLLSAIGQLNAGAPPVRIGEINPLTGNLALHGQEIHQGILYAVEESNRQGGIQGRQVELLSRDDQSRPEIALNQTQDLLYREKVVGLVGGYVDSLVGPISTIAARYKVPYIASASLQRGLTASGNNPYFFRVSRLDGIVEPVCQFIQSDLKPKKAAILYLATPGSTEFATDVKTCLEKAGIEIPLFEKFRPGSPDFSVFLLKIKQEGINVLISGGFYPDNLLLVRQLREQAITLQAFLAPWGVAYEKFIQEMGSSSEGLFGTCAWNPGITPPGTTAASQAFVEGFHRHFGQLPNTTTMHGYTSARALLTAIDHVLQKKEDLTGSAISRELRHLNLVLPMQQLQFDPQGDPQHYHHVVVQIQQGKLVAIFPPERASGKMIVTGQ